MALTAQEKFEVWQIAMRLNIFPGSVAKTQGPTNITNMDDALDAQAATFNNALTPEYRTEMTLAQKSRFFAPMGIARAGLLNKLKGMLF